MRKVLILAVVLFTALAANAVEGSEVLYVSGTSAGMAAGRIGHLDVSSTSALLFQADGGTISIPYQSMQTIEYRSDLARHLGVLPAMAAGMVRKRQRRHFVSITFRGPDDGIQVAVFEVPKTMPLTLLPILRGRASQACFAENYRTCPVPSTRRP